MPHVESRGQSSESAFCEVSQRWKRFVRDSAVVNAPCLEILIFVLCIAHTSDEHLDSSHRPCVSDA